MGNSVEKTQFDKFFKAKSVAVIGASSKPGKIGYEVLRNLACFEYKGKVFPVNPARNEILGLKCYPSVLDIPEKIDLAVLVIPAEHTPKVVEECGKKGITNIVIISGGFKELGEHGKELEEKTAEIARKYGIRIIGPNCIGVFDSKTRLDTFFQSRERMIRPPPGPIAFLTQSGTYGCAFLEWAAESGIGISKFVSYGNRIDVDEADLLRYLAADEDTKVIAIYLEGLGNGKKFIEAAKDVVKKKPVIVLKGGRTKEGAKAAQSHTGWLGGEERIYRGAFKQAGIIWADTFEELFDMAKALAMQPPAQGPRVAMVSNGAGPMVQAVDACIEKGLKIAKLSQETISKLKERLPPFYIVNNPVDVTGSANSKDYKIVLEAFLEDINVHILMPFFVFQDTPLDEGIIDVMKEINEKSNKPIVVGAAGGPYTRKMSKILEKIGIPVYPIPERTVAAAYALYSYGKIKEKAAEQN